MRRLAPSVSFAVLAAFAGACTFRDFDPSTPVNPGQPTAPTEVTAVAGSDLVVVEGARVALTGQSTRSLVGAPTLSWSQSDGPPVVLSNPSDTAPTFRAPLAPARLVFQLQARVDDKADVDEVVVDVVADASDAVDFASNVAESPADVVGDQGPVTLLFHWPDAAAPNVTARCRTRGAVVVAQDGDDLSVTVDAATLPCPIVVDDSDTAGAAVGRAVATLWPSGTALQDATTTSVPSVVAPSELITIGADIAGGVAIAAADGVVLEVARDGSSLTAPRHPGRLALIAERRVGGVSGGVVVVPVDVAVSGKSAPVALGGPDLEVAPGGRFRIAATARDDDGDDVTLTVEQVLGPHAEPVAGFDDVLTAPDDAGTLLFHVVADDGRAASAPDTVRVVVDPGAQNRPPVLSLPTTIFATPGAEFVIDAEAGASDDAGLITSWEIVQNPDDEVAVLEGAVAVPVVRLAARDAGDEYRFRVSAYDFGGLGVTVDVTVVVEDAGPFVDAVRGTADGTGSAARPFATVAAALDTAARHRFPALLLAVGSHDVSGRLPDGLGVRGGFRFVDGGYVSEAEPSTLQLTGDLFVVDGDLSDVRVTGTGALRLEQDVDLDGVAAGDLVAGIAVEPGARVAAHAVVGSVDVDRASFTCVACRLDALAAHDATTQLVPDGVGAHVVSADVDGGLLLVASGVALGPLRARGNANVALGAVDVTAVGVTAIDVSDATVDLGGSHVVVAEAADGNSDFTAVVVSAGGVLRGSATFELHSDVGVAGVGVVDLEGSGVTGFGGALIDVAVLRLARSVVRGGTVVADNADVEASIVDVVFGADDVVGFTAARGALRHLTLRSPATAFELGSDVVVRNSIVAAVSFGVGSVSVLDHVGFVIADENFDADALGCVACAVGTDDAFENAAAGDLHLAAGPNPFVDVAADDDVAFDVDGDAFVAGAADLGADERTDSALP